MQSLRTKSARVSCHPIGTTAMSANAVDAAVSYQRRRRPPPPPLRCKQASGVSYWRARERVRYGLAKSNESYSEIGQCLCIILA